MKVPDLRTLLFGRDTVDLGAVEQVVSRSQIRAIGQALAAARPVPSTNAAVPYPSSWTRSTRRVAEGGLDALDDRRPGDLSAFRRHELAAALNRLRSLRVV